MKNPNIILHTIEYRFMLTHTTLGYLSTIVENSTVTDYLTSFKKQWPTVDFLDYTYNARYLKDFDTEENRKGELWAPGPYLGPEKKSMWTHRRPA